MVLGLIGTKKGMTQAFDESEQLTPVTVFEVAPNPVVQIKQVSTADGYSAVKVAFNETRSRRLSQAEAGLFKKANVAPYKGLKEFRLENTDAYSVGDTLDVSLFEVGEIVDVTGQSKGRGFQGTVKRHGFRGGPKTHGQSDRHRAPGSIGQSSDPSRVFKGTRMSGHMGDRQVTVKGLKIIQIDVERNLLVIKGAVPGARGDSVIIKKRS
ncbi:MAG: 50S ribosomal protein L3 [Candidatus Latescibacteria bacterium]|nr:50S ribosomal protein L3 [Candidatus Latescibacterota bacterium]MBT4140508.1 50S ribosomal protein L3 [Candidatus Latescibacterota bacterium]MBT5830422.1 50S ribosomal protein L3 [Candidatus Latescibacterota bacterium]